MCVMRGLWHCSLHYQRSGPIMPHYRCQTLLIHYDTWQGGGHKASHCWDAICYPIFGIENLFIKTAIKRFPTRRSPHQILSDGVILIARLAQGIRGECVQTLWELFTSLITIRTILNLATTTLMVVTSHALKINDHFNSNTLSMAAHVTRAAPLPTFVSCHHFKLYHLALVSRCFARRSCSHLHHWVIHYLRTLQLWQN